jgi:hypothetical protein
MHLNSSPGLHVNSTKLSNVKVYNINEVTGEKNKKYEKRIERYVVYSQELPVFGEFSLHPLGWMPVSHPEANFLKHQHRSATCTYNFQ